MLSKSKHFFSVGPFHESAAKCEQFLNNLEKSKMYAITFLCNPLLPKLDEALITPYIEALKGDSITWLGDGVAAEIYVKTRPRNIKKIPIPVNFKRHDSNQKNLN